MTFFHQINRSIDSILLAMISEARSESFAVCLREGEPPISRLSLQNARMCHGRVMRISCQNLSI